MKKKILVLLLLTITILITLGGLNQTDAARICANCKAGDHRNCPNRGYTHNSTSHSICFCFGKTFANAVVKAFSNGYRLQYDPKFQQKVLDNHKKKIKFEMI